MAELLTPDLCIVGAGAAGLQAALAACELGASVVLVERGRMGGVALNAGSIPSKALVAAGAFAHAIRSGAPFGVAGEEPRVSFRKLHDHVHAVVAGIAPRVSVERLQALGVQVLAAEGRFLDPRTLEAGDMSIRARRFLIATGAVPVLPPIEGLEAVPYFTTETIFANTRKLTHLVVIGAAAAGLELAQAYNRLGTQVTVVEPGAPLAGADPELATIVLRRLKEEGVEIRAETEVLAIQGRSQGIGVRIRTAGGEATLDASHILVCADRLPQLDRLELERARIRRSAADRRRLQLTSGLRTSNRRVYAVGDAAGTSSSHGAAWQAEALVRRLLLGLPQRRPPRPEVIYTDPEIAETGLSEAAARARFGDGFRVLRASFADNDRARALGRTDGLAKLITDPRGRLLGAGIAGPAAGELATLFALAIAQRLTAPQLRELAAPHPTLLEIAVDLGSAFDRDRPPGPLQQRLLALVRLLP
ncbi:MAG TPA: FAD-dependent oxidoreductase [Devosiaceae bacterium]|nr:FAD-dependent oxidoreductase [Devosiaceae bacterium]